jgi:hypothetical protein
MKVKTRVAAGQPRSMRFNSARSAASTVCDLRSPRATRLT